MRVGEDGMSPFTSEHFIIEEEKDCNCYWSYLRWRDLGKDVGCFDCSEEGNGVVS